MIRSIRTYAALFLLTALVSSCSQSIDTQQTGLALPDSAQRFFWSSSELSAGLDYTISQNNVTTDHHIVSSDDGVTIHDATLNTTALVVHTTRDTVLVDSVGASSIFSLPAGYFFASGNVGPPTHLPVRAMLVTRTERIVAATDSGLYYSDDKINWTHELAKPVAMLSQDSIGNIYASVSDQIFISTNDGRTWASLGTPHAGTSITAIACSNTATYIGYESVFGVERSQGTSLSLPKLSRLTSGSVRCLAIGQIDSLEDLVVGEPDQVVTYGVRVDSFAVFHPNAIVVDSSTIYVACDSGIVEKGVYSGPSTLLRNTGGPRATTLLKLASEDILAATAGAGIWEITPSQQPKLFNPGPLMTTAMQLRGTELLVASTTGISLFDLQTKSYNTLIGPTQQTDSIGGLLLLLRDQLQPNGSWRAGVVRGQGLGSGVAITARVMDKADLLHVSPAHAGADSIFNNVLQIRYAAELSDATLASNMPLFLVVYYAEGIGPVLIEEYLNTTLQSRAQLIH